MCGRRCAELGGVQRRDAPVEALAGLAHVEHALVGQPEAAQASRELGLRRALAVEPKVGDALEPGRDGARCRWVPPPRRAAARPRRCRRCGCVPAGPRHRTVGEQTGGANEIERGPFAGHRRKRDTKGGSYAAPGFRPAPPLDRAARHSRLDSTARTPRAAGGTRLADRAAAGAPATPPVSPPAMRPPFRSGRLRHRIAAFRGMPRPETRRNVTQTMLSRPQVARDVLTRAEAEARAARVSDVAYELALTLPADGARLHAARRRSPSRSRRSMTRSSSTTRANGSRASSSMAATRLVDLRDNRHLAPGEPAATAATASRSRTRTATTTPATASTASSTPRTAASTSTRTSSRSRRTACFPVSTSPT